MVSVNSKNVKSESELGGNSRPAPGQYLAVIQDSDETFTGKHPDSIWMLFKVLAGTVPGQGGRMIDNRFSWKPENQDQSTQRITRVAMACGYLKPGEEKEIPLADLHGMPLIIEVVPHKYKNKEEKDVETSQVSFSGFFSPSNPDVKDVMAIPDVRAALAKVRADLANKPANTGSATEDEWANV